MDATFFVGSGISLPSGLPTVTDLTNNLFEKSYFETYKGETIKQGEDSSQNDLTLVSFPIFRTILK
jgi:NAD-dependent SIR2 family protein deacetylase